ncbi:hypothetical protein AC1031_006934 [Aphanomyces cochlioides]|nr:hypothetical protein AC1031_006934 [Aphanomyces cochlioides]
MASTESSGEQAKSKKNGSKVQSQRILWTNDSDGGGMNSMEVLWISILRQVSCGFDGQDESRERSIELIIELVLHVELHPQISPLLALFEQLPALFEQQVPGTDFHN